MRRAELAQEYFKQGYACSQAVILAFKDLIDVKEEELIKLALPLGGGLGRQRLVCGAVSGMSVAYGLVLGSSENTIENKQNTYATVRQLCDKFDEEYGTLICEKLLEDAAVLAQKGGNPEERTKEYYATRPCERIVYVAAKILEDYLIEQEKIEK